jgi:hypothetical protein
MFFNFLSNNSDIVVDYTPVRLRDKTTNNNCKIQSVETGEMYNFIHKMYKKAEPIMVAFNLDNEDYDSFFEIEKSIIKNKSKSYYKVLLIELYQVIKNFLKSKKYKSKTLINSDIDLYQGYSSDANELLIIINNIQTRLTILN